MAKLTGVIQDIIGIFQSYSKKDCSHHKLNKDELNLLIQNEFADVIKNPKDPGTIATLIKILDENNDGEVDFNEFCDLLCKVLKAYYKVVYESEDACPQQDTTQKTDGAAQQKPSAGTPSETKPDSPSKYYQRPLYPKDDENQSTTKPGQSGNETSKEDQPKCDAVTTVQSSTQTDPRSTQQAAGQQGSSKYDQQKPDPRGADKKPGQDTLPSPWPQKPGDSDQQTNPQKQQEKDQGPQPDKAIPKPPVGSESKDQTPQPDKATQKPPAEPQCKDQTSQPDKVTPKPPVECQAKDQVPQQDKLTPKPPVESQTKDQVPHQDKVTPKPSVDPQSKDQDPQSPKEGPKYEQTQKSSQQSQQFYQHTVYPPQVPKSPRDQCKEHEIPSQPPPYSPTKQEPKPEEQQHPPQEPQQHQRQHVYQYQSHFSFQKKNH